MKAKWMAATGLVFLTLPLHAMAAGPGVTAKAGTLGLGVEASLGVTDMFTVRVGANRYDYQFDATEDDITYDFEYQLESNTAILDWHPFSGTFRISAGLVDNGNRIAGIAKPASDYSIGGNTYTANEIGSLNGVVDFDDTATFLGIGWSTTGGSDTGFGLAVELGVLKQGSPSVDLTADGGIISDPQFQQDIQDEEDALEAELSDYDTHPVVSIGLSYAF